MRLVAGRPLRILDFDIENMPLSYWMPDRPTARVTAIAWAFADKPREVEVRLLGRDPEESMYLDFKTAYDEADLATGHFVLKHDLPILQGQLMDLGLPLLGPKMVCDTKVHMIKKADVPATQEFLCEMLGIPIPKVHMTQRMWRDANKLHPDYLHLTEARVVGDVKQHMLLRLAMLEAGLLHSPRMWKP